MKKKTKILLFSAAVVVVAVVVFVLVRKRKRRKILESVLELSESVGTTVSSFGNKKSSRIRLNGKYRNNEKYAINVYPEGDWFYGERTFENGVDYIVIPPYAKLYGSDGSVFIQVSAVGVKEQGSVSEYRLPSNYEWFVDTKFLNI